MLKSMNYNLNIDRNNSRRDPKASQSLLPCTVAKSLKGSISIEASLVVPIFIIAIFMMLSIINLLRFHLILQESIHQEVKYLCMMAYDNGQPSTDIIRSRVLDRIDNKILYGAPIENGCDGISFEQSDISNREIIGVIANYKAGLPYDIFGLFSYRFNIKCIMHTYIGYENGMYSSVPSYKEEEYVYITPTGTVYHRNPECSYLRLSIKETSIDEVSKLRNSSGHKYYKCDICNKDSDGKLYVTDDGTCYHSSLACSGIKRTVMSVPLSEVCNRKGCSRCAK